METSENAPIPFRGEKAAPNSQAMNELLLDKLSLVGDATLALLFPPGDLWDEDPCKVHGFSGSPPGRDGKVERWLLKQQARRESFWDTSSTDSETRGGDVGKTFRRPALVRTKAERIPLFDEFFDKEF